MSGVVFGLIVGFSAGFGLFMAVVCGIELGRYWD